MCITRVVMGHGMLATLPRIVKSPNHWYSANETVSASLLLQLSMTARAKRVEEARPALRRSISSHQ